MLTASLLLVATMLASPGGGDTKSKPPIYDEAANATAQVDAAIARAKRDNKRVLVQWGANWCGWCHLLHELYAKDAAIGRELLYEYELVLVDVGRFDKNQELMARLEAPVKDHGIPYLTVLDSDGKPIVQQDSGALEAGDHHDPAKVMAFLKDHAAPQQDAETVLATALARAKSEQKLALVHFGAPWCPYCRKLDTWAAGDDVAKSLGTRAIDVKIDVDRMTNGKAVLARYRKGDEGGIPWFAFIDGAGAVVATSDGKNGNLGFPTTDEEITEFDGMLAKAGFADTDRAALLASLRAFPKR